MTDALFIALDAASVLGAVAMVILLADVLRDCFRERHNRLAACGLLAWAVIAGGWAVMLAGEDMLSRIVVAAFAARFAGV